MKDHVGREDELIMPGAVVVRPSSVRMIVAKLGADGNEPIGPPGDANRMLGIIRGEASSAAHLVIKIFVSHGEECVPCDPKHGVVHNRPLRRVTAMDRKRAASKWHLVRGMINGVVFPH